MAEEVLLYLSLIIVIAAFLTIIARMIKQPPLIAYLLTGVLVGPLALNFIGGTNSVLITTFAHIGVALLLFIVGLNLDLRVFKEIGLVSSIAGVTEVAITIAIAFLIALGIGFSSVTAIYLAVALSFSSTVVVVKILSDKKEIGTLHGRIAIGILIIEDFVAAIVLMTLPLLKGDLNIYLITQKLAIVLALIASVILISIFVLQKFMSYLAKNQEVLFITGIAWALVLATLFDKLGFSLEIGALIAGISLASSKYTLELGGKIKPLRDFFVIIFFVFFGSQLTTSLTFELIRNALLFSIFILIGKPIIVMSILSIFGYKKRTNFLAGSSLAQVSEFSLILILLSYSLGFVSQEIISLAVLIAVITIGVSSYSIYYSHSIFNKISHLLNVFEGRKEINENIKEESYDIILFGYHRIGYKILRAIKSLNKKFIIVDYNPKVVLALDKWGIPAVFGDAADKNFLSEIPLEKAKLIISTIPEENSNLTIRERLKELNSEAIFLATAEQPREAFELYKEGVDYVIVPHHLGGDYTSNLIEKFGLDKNKYKSLGKKHKSDIQRAKNNAIYY